MLNSLKLPKNMLESCLLKNVGYFFDLALEDEFKKLGNSAAVKLLKNYGVGTFFHFHLEKNIQFTY